MIGADAQFMIDRISGALPAPAVTEVFAVRQRHVLHRGSAAARLWIEANDVTNPSGRSTDTGRPKSLAGSAVIG